MGVFEQLKSIGNRLERYNLKKPAIIFLSGLIFFLLVDNIVMPIAVRHGQIRHVPNVSGITLAEANTILKNTGFKLVLEGEKYDQRYPPGYVVSQNPKYDAEVKSGRRIYVMTSMGERLVQVPRLMGRSERDANFITKSSRLILDHISFEHSSWYPEGVVSEQSIKDGKEVRIGTPISIVVSLGPFPDRFLVPDLKGKDLEAAIKRIQKSGLNLGAITYQVEPDLLPNTVISQSIEPDEEVPIGTIIGLVVSQDPAL